MDMSDDEEMIQSDMIEIGDEEDIDNEELTKAVRSQSEDENKKEKFLIKYLQISLMRKLKLLIYVNLMN